MDTKVSMARTMSAGKRAFGRPIAGNISSVPEAQAVSGDDPYDLQLAAEAGKGDKGAFERLMWRWWDRIRGYCASFVAFDPDMAEEAAQESLIRIYKALPRWRKESPLGGYIYGICRTASNDVIRRCARHHARTAQVEEIEALPVQSPHQTGEMKVMQDEAKVMLGRAMEQLEPDDRAMLYLHEVEGKGLAELGSLFGLPIGTVKSRLSRTRDKLGALLKEMGYELH